MHDSQDVSVGTQTRYDKRDLSRISELLQEIFTPMFNFSYEDQSVILNKMVAVIN